MRVLVTAASRHNATEDMAEAIATVLRDSLSAQVGKTVVDVMPADEVVSVDDYDAVVLGSAIYLGKWLKDANILVQEHAAALRERPVWLFSSGPVGDPPLPAAEPDFVPRLIALTGAREHQLFAGRLRQAVLGLGERAALRVVRAPEGDFRDWDAIHDWANRIADDLAES
jgi:menaquinone-dependent protoporphyrinogen oxidase